MTRTKTKTRKKRLEIVVGFEGRKNYNVKHIFAVDRDEGRDEHLRLVRRRLAAIYPNDKPIIMSVFYLKAAL